MGVKKRVPRAIQIVGEDTPASFSEEFDVEDMQEGVVYGCARHGPDVDNRAPDQGASPDDHQYNGDQARSQDEKSMMSDDDGQYAWDSQHFSQPVEWNGHVSQERTEGGTTGFDSLSAMDIDHYGDPWSLDCGESDLPSEFPNPSDSGDESLAWEGCSQAADDEVLQNFLPGHEVLPPRPFEDSHGAPYATGPPTWAPGTFHHGH